MDAAREIAQLAQRLAGARPRVRQQLGRRLRFARELLLGHAEAHAERDEPRLRAVVEVTLDPAQLGLLHVDRSGAARLERRDPLRQGARAGRATEQRGRVSPGREQRDEQRPHRPEVAAPRAAHTPVRNSTSTIQTPAWIAKPTSRRCRCHQAAAPSATKTTQAWMPSGRREHEQRPHRPEVAARGQRPDQHEEQVQPARGERVDHHARARPASSASRLLRSRGTSPSRVTESRRQGRRQRPQHNAARPSATRPAGTQRQSLPERVNPLTGRHSRLRRSPSRTAAGSAGTARPPASATSATASAKPTVRRNEQIDLRAPQPRVGEHRPRAAPEPLPALQRGNPIGAPSSPRLQPGLRVCAATHGQRETRSPRARPAA